MKIYQLYTGETEIKEIEADKINALYYWLNGEKYKRYTEGCYAYCTYESYDEARKNMIDYFESQIRQLEYTIKSSHEQIIKLKETLKNVS